MKKFISLLLLVTVCLTFQVHAVTEKENLSHQKESAFIDYTWYNDPWYSDPVGTNSSIAIELNRLRLLYPGYVFSSTPGFGLLPFEWGYNSPTITAIIYSDL